MPQRKSSKREHPRSDGTIAVQASNGDWIGVKPSPKSQRPASGPGLGSSAAPVVDAQQEATDSEPYALELEVVRAAAGSAHTPTVAERLEARSAERAKEIQARAERNERAVAYVHEWAKQHPEFPHPTLPLLGRETVAPRPVVAAETVVDIEVNELHYVSEEGIPFSYNVIPTHIRNWGQDSWGECITCTWDYEGRSYRITTYVPEGRDPGEYAAEWVTYAISKHPTHHDIPLRRPVTRPEGTQEAVGRQLAAAAKRREEAIRKSEERRAAETIEDRMRKHLEGINRGFENYGHYD